MTPMIDVVFQMIIFFVATADMDRKAFDENIRLAMSPHAPAVEQRDPRTITVELDRRGRIHISRAILTPEQLNMVIRRTVQQYGQGVPVVIRGDGRTRHDDVRRVMDICAQNGLWRIKFAAVKERAAPVQ